MGLYDSQRGGKEPIGLALGGNEYTPNVQFEENQTESGTRLARTIFWQASRHLSEVNQEPCRKRTTSGERPRYFTYRYLNPDFLFSRTSFGVARVGSCGRNLGENFCLERFQVFGVHEDGQSNDGTVSVAASTQDKQQQTINRDLGRSQ